MKIRTGTDRDELSRGPCPAVLGSLGKRRHRPHVIGAVVYTRDPDCRAVILIGLTMYRISTARVSLINALRNRACATISGRKRAGAWRRNYLSHSLWETARTFGGNTLTYSLWGRASTLDYDDLINTYFCIYPLHSDEIPNQRTPRCLRKQLMLWLLKRYSDIRTKHHAMSC